MSSMPWIKFFTEVLHDPKMGRMSDHLWRRTGEVFLLAGEYDMGGLLPPLSDMAWELRTDEASLLEDLNQLKEVEITEVLEDGTWFVINFAERQGRPQSEKQEQWRERQKRYREKQEASEQPAGQAEDTAESHANVTRDITQDAPVTNPSRVDKSREDKRKSTRAARAPSDLYQIAQALAHVTGLDFEKNKARLFREAKTFTMADLPQLQRDYARDGPWYCLDWRGKKGEKPTLAQIRETWGNLKNGKPHDDFRPSEVY